MKQTLAIFFGGISPEHEVSVLSARSVYQAVDQDRFDVILLGITKQGKWNVCTPADLIHHPIVPTKPDRVSLCFAENNPGIMVNNQFYPIHCAFPVLHGCGGEDGTIQGLLEIAEIPYVGCDMESSVLCMNKSLTKIMLAEAQIKQTPYRILFYEDWQNKKITLQEIEHQFSYPLFVKPSHGGSSIGISKAHDPEELLVALKEAFSVEREIILEKYIKGKELECSVLGSILEQKATFAGEVKPLREFYDYEAKYIENSTQLFIPAVIDESIHLKIKQTAIRAFQTLRCYGMARVDFFLEEDTNNLYLNEINTIPGFTAISLYPKLWEAEGVSYKDLILKLIELAWERKPIRKRMVKGE